MSRPREADHAELSALVARLHPRLVRVANGVLHDDEEARDAVQDAYLQAVRHLDRFDRRARMSSWLHRIVVNAALMRLRGRRRRPVEPLDPATVAADTASMETAIHERRLRAVVRRSLAEVRPEHRAVIMLRDIDERDPAEVARTLRTTRGGLKVRAYRARQALRVRLAQLGVTGGDTCARPAAGPVARPRPRAWPLQEVS